MDRTAARRRPHRPSRAPVCAAVLAAAIMGTASAAMAAAADCAAIGLVKSSAMVIQLREAAQADRTVTVYRDAAGRDWFVPLQDASLNDGHPERTACSWLGATFWKLPGNDSALRFDEDSDLLTFLDLSHATNVIDGRKSPLKAQAQPLDSAGVNYQLTLNYAGNELARTSQASTFGELYARKGDWYYDTTLAWNQGGRVARYESYALRESLDTGTFVRLGDSTTSPTALGEAIQFAGLSWGTDRTLRPGDFSPVLPTLRNGNALAGPLAVYINDNLQFQQNLQNGVYDLRNLPAQQGFNRYSVRTLDAQGNPVIVQREIYLPASLLPPEITSWRLDTGVQRRDFFTANAHYGGAFVAGSYARGLTYDSTVSAQALVSRDASTGSLGWDQRLSDLWTGHIGLLAARNAAQRGQAVQARLDGGSRWWRLLVDWTQAPRALPGLGSQAALVTQRLVQAQWTGIPDWNFGLTLAQSQRENAAREEVNTVNVSTRVPDTPASINLSLTQVRSVAGKQDNLMVSMFLPLAPSESGRNGSIFASQGRTDGVEISRVQYGSSGASARNANWGLGYTKASMESLTAMDAYWQQNTATTELMANGRVGTKDSNGLVSLRSGLLWTGGGLYATRPINGSFAMVSTGHEGVKVFYENRPMGLTDARGMLLVPELRPLETNRLSLDPSTWPLQWTAADLERQVVPPRGGGVLVSFRINAQVWPEQAMVMPLGPDGKVFPAGTLVNANADGEVREAVVDRRGQVWIAELLPAATFQIVAAGKRCDFRLPPPDSSAGANSDANASANGDNAQSRKAPAPPIPLQPLRCLETS